MSKPLTAAKVRAVLKKSGLPKSEYRRSGMGNWGESTTGYRVSGGSKYFEAISAEWYERHVGFDVDGRAKRMIVGTATLVKALEAAGITGDPDGHSLKRLRWVEEAAQ